MRFRKPIDQTNNQNQLALANQLKQLSQLRVKLVPPVGADFAQELVSLSDQAIGYKIVRSRPRSFWCSFPACLYAGGEANPKPLPCFGV